MSSSSSPATLKDELHRFDVIIGSNPLVEEIVAAECYGAPGYKIVALRQMFGFPAPDSDVWKGKRVLQCGTYLPVTVLSAIADNAASVEVWPYSPDEVARIQKEDVKGHLNVALFDVDTAVFPRAKRLIRRSLSGGRNTPEAAEDNQFYRGLMHHAYAEPFTHEEAICAWLRGEQLLTEEQLIMDGVTVEMEHCRIADDIIMEGGLLISLAARVEKDTIWNCDMRVVATGSALVMPIAQALVKGGEFIGVVIRPNLKNRTTSVTAYTEQDADLSWMEEAPWNGGGKPNCKGATLQGLVPLETLLEWLQKVVPKKQANADAASSK